MDLRCQQECIENLKRCSRADKHSILIEGSNGCGKTYLAKMYANMIGASDVISVEPSVNELRQCIDSCLSLITKVAIIVENLDAGTVNSSYVLLKFLEEPASNVYIIVTCRNTKNVPDTILSRTLTLSVDRPHISDVVTYMKDKYIDRYQSLKDNEDIMKCITSLADVDTICNLSIDNLHYILNISNINIKKLSISDAVWQLGHFEDKTECPIDIVVKYLMNINQTIVVMQWGTECIKDIFSGKIAKHVALTKFVYRLKYIG